MLAPRQELYTCLVCGLSFCYNTDNMPTHVKKHYYESGAHCMFIGADQTIYCFKCEGYVELGSLDEYSQVIYRKLVEIYLNPGDCVTNRSESPEPRSTHPLSPSPSTRPIFLLQPQVMKPSGDTGTDEISMRRGRPGKFPLRLARVAPALPSSRNRGIRPGGMKTTARVPGQLPLRDFDRAPGLRKCRSAYGNLLENYLRHKESVAVGTETVLKLDAAVGQTVDQECEERSSKPKSRPAEKGTNTDKNKSKGKSGATTGNKKPGAKKPEVEAKAAATSVTGEEGKIVPAEEEKKQPSVMSTPRARAATKSKEIKKETRKKASQPPAKTQGKNASASKGRKPPPPAKKPIPSPSTPVPEKSRKPSTKFANAPPTAPVSPRQQNVSAASPNASLAQEEDKKAMSGAETSKDSIEPADVSASIKVYRNAKPPPSRGRGSSKKSVPSPAPAAHEAGSAKSKEQTKNSESCSTTPAKPGSSIPPTPTTMERTGVAVSPAPDPDRRVISPFSEPRHEGAEEEDTKCNAGAEKTPSSVRSKASNNAPSAKKSRKKPVVETVDLNLVAAPVQNSFLDTSTASTAAVVSVSVLPVNSRGEVGPETRPAEATAISGKGKAEESKQVEKSDFGMGTESAPENVVLQGGSPTVRLCLSLDRTDEEEKMRPERVKSPNLSPHCSAPVEFSHVPALAPLDEIVPKPKANPPAASKSEMQVDIAKLEEEHHDSNMDGHARDPTEEPKPASENKEEKKNGRSSKNSTHKRKSKKTYQRFITTISESGSESKEKGTRSEAGSTPSAAEFCREQEEEEKMPSSEKFPPRPNHEAGTTEIPGETPQIEDKGHTEMSANRIENLAHAEDIRRTNDMPEELNSHKTEGEENGKARSALGEMSVGGTENGDIKQEESMSETSARKTHALHTDVVSAEEDKKIVTLSGEAVAVQSQAENNAMGDNPDLRTTSQEEPQKKADASNADAGTKIGVASVTRSPTHDQNTRLKAEIVPLPEAVRTATLGSIPADLLAFGNLVLPNVDAIPPAAGASADIHSETVAPGSRNGGRADIVTQTSGPAGVALQGKTAEAEALFSLRAGAVPLRKPEEAKDALEKSAEKKDEEAARISQTDQKGAVKTDQDSDKQARDNAVAAEAEAHGKDTKVEAMLGGDDKTASAAKEDEKKASEARGVPNTQTAPGANSECQKGDAGPAPLSGDAAALVQAVKVHKDQDQQDDGAERKNANGIAQPCTDPSPEAHKNESSAKETRDPESGKEKVASQAVDESKQNVDEVATQGKDVVVPAVSSEAGVTQKASEKDEEEKKKEADSMPHAHVPSEDTKHIEGSSGLAASHEVDPILTSKLDEHKGEAKTETKGESETKSHEDHKDPAGIPSETAIVENSAAAHFRVEKEPLPSSQAQIAAGNIADKIRGPTDSILTSKPAEHCTENETKDISHRVVDSQPPRPAGVGVAVPSISPATETKEAAGVSIGVNREEDMQAKLISESTAAEKTDPADGKERVTAQDATSDARPLHDIQVHAEPVVASLSAADAGSGGKDNVPSSESQHKSAANAPAAGTESEHMQAEGEHRAGDKSVDTVPPAVNPATQQPLEPTLTQKGAEAGGDPSVSHISVPEKDKASRPGGEAVGSAEAGGAPSDTRLPPAQAQDPHSEPHCEANSVLVAGRVDEPAAKYSVTNAVSSAEGNPCGPQNELPQPGSAKQNRESKGDPVVNRKPENVEEKASTVQSPQPAQSSDRATGEIKAGCENEGTTAKYVPASLEEETKKLGESSANPASHFMSQNDAAADLATEHAPTKGLFGETPLPGENSSLGPHSAHTAATEVAAAPKTENVPVLPAAEVPAKTVPERAEGTTAQDHDLRLQSADPVLGAVGAKTGSETNAVGPIPVCRDETAESAQPAAAIDHRGQLAETAHIATGNQGDPAETLRMGGEGVRAGVVPADAEGKCEVASGVTERPGTNLSSSVRENAQTYQGDNPGGQVPVTCLHPESAAEMGNAIDVPAVEEKKQSQPDLAASLAVPVPAATTDEKRKATQQLAEALLNDLKSPPDSKKLSLQREISPRTYSKSMAASLPVPVSLLRPLPASGLRPSSSGALLPPMESKAESKGDMSVSSIEARGSRFVPTDPEAKRESSFDAIMNDLQEIGGKGRSVTHGIDSHATAAMKRRQQNPFCEQKKHLAHSNTIPAEPEEGKRESRFGATMDPRKPDPEEEEDYDLSREGGEIDSQVAEVSMDFSGGKKGQHKRAMTIGIGECGIPQRTVSRQTKDYGLQQEFAGQDAGEGTTPIGMR